MQRTVAPILNVDIRLLIHLTDGGRRHLAAPQCLGNILYAPDGDAGQVHLDDGSLELSFETLSVTSPEAVVRFRL